MWTILRCLGTRWMRRGSHAASEMRFAAVYCLTVQVWAAAPAIRYKGKVQPFGCLSTSKRQRCCFSVMKELNFWNLNGFQMRHFLVASLAGFIQLGYDVLLLKRRQVNLKDSMPTWTGSQACDRNPRLPLRPGLPRTLLFQQGGM